MKSFCLSIFYCLFVIPLFGQYKLSGKVVDEQEEAIPYANVLLLNPSDSSLIKGSITEADGHYQLADLDAGRYLLNISYLGYETVAESITFQGDSSNGITVLKTYVKALEDVVVTATKPLFELSLEGMVINVQSSITTAGGTALEVLERSPGVVVDRSRNALSLVGKDGVVVMINGKIARQPLDAIMQMLDGMAADNIEKIELITAPSAKYEAEGNGGIINIQMIKREDLGTNGNYSLSLGYGKEDKQGGNLAVNHRNESLLLFGNVSYNRDHSYELFTNDRRVGALDETFISRTVTQRDPITTNLDARVGLDYTVNSKTTVGFLLTGFYNKWEMEAANSGFETLADSTTYFNIENLEQNEWTNLMGNFNLTQKINKGSLTFDLDYLYYKQQNPTDYINTFSDDQEQILAEEIIRASKETPVNIWVSKIDYAVPLNDKMKLDLGVKGTLSDLKNNVLVESNENGQFITDEQLSENALLEERIGAMYSALNISFTEKTKVNVGLRYEYTSTNLATAEEPDVVNLNYGSLFPTFFLLQKINDNWSTQFSYGRRITRPTYNDLAPFVIFIDPNTYFFGNTSLRPAFSHNLKADLSFKQYFFTLQYNQENDAIARYQPTLLEGTNQQVFTSMNLDNRKTFSAMLSIPITITKWWNIRTNIMGVSREVVTTRQETLSANYVQLFGNMNFSLPLDFSIELSGFYRSELITGISKVSALSNLNLGIQKKLNTTSTLRFSFNNIFGYEYDVFTAEGLIQDYSTNTNYRYEPRIVRLTYSASFGNHKLKSARRRNTGSEDIRSRVN